MDFMWLLLGIVLVAVIYSAREIIVKEWKSTRERSAARSNSIDMDTVRPFLTRQREVRWISMKECEGLVHTSDDVVFVAVGKGAERKSFPFPGMQAISVTPSQLAGELQWLPPSSRIVLYGDVNLCSPIIGSLDYIPGAPPIYVLKSISAHPGIRAFFLMM